MFKHEKSSSLGQPVADVKASSAAGPAASSGPPGDKNNLSSDAIAVHHTETISADSKSGSKRDSKRDSKPGVDSKIHDGALDVDPHKKLLPRREPWLAEEIAKAKAEYEKMTDEEKARVSKFCFDQGRP